MLYKLIIFFTGFFGCTVFGASIPVQNPEGQFIYCVEGMCAPLSQLFLYRLGIPLNTHHQCVRSHDYALTFDDGPSQNFASVLDILASEKVKATFFVIGQNLVARDRKGADLIRLAFAGGHEIANHTFSHKDLTSLSDKEILEEVGSTRDLILKILGETPKTHLTTMLLRPPFGYVNFRVQALLEAHGYTTVRWNADRFDWRDNLEAQSQVILERATKQFDLIDSALRMTDNKSILDLNHDFSNATLAALPTLITNIKARGYQFVTLTECLDSKKTN